MEKSRQIKELVFNRDMNKKILVSLTIVAAVAAVVVGATTAFFSDTETSEGNTFTAGAIDLGIDNESYYNGEFNPGTSWDLTFDLDEDGPHFFFNFADLKPGDWGEDTISVHVDNNDAWACMSIELTATDDNGLTEPEEDDGDTTGGDGEGELQNHIRFMWWADDGDNVLEDDETNNIFSQTKLGDLNGFNVALADSMGNGVLSHDPLKGATTYYIGKAWCFGDITVAAVPQDGFSDVMTPATDNEGIGNVGNGTPGQPSDGGFTCSGADALNNITQTDSVVGSLSFFAVQSRNNGSFKCENGGIGCLEKADVMLVLDRSGSVGGDMSTLKNAAKAFVDALSPSADGVHIGMVSFSDSASLDVHLTSDGQSVKNAIDALSAGGFTNLSGGIGTADAELDNPGDGHDRADGESPDFMVIITDGAPNRGGGELGAKSASDSAKADGIEIFAVGVGITASAANFLKDSIVSSPALTHYFDAANFSALEAVLADIAECPAP